MATRRLRRILLALALTGGATPGAVAQSVTLTASHPNIVSFWNDVANRTILAQIPTATTPEEQRPSFVHDTATVHLAIYDAVIAIEGRYRPFAVRPAAPAAGASTDAGRGLPAGLRPAHGGDPGRPGQDDGRGARCRGRRRHRAAARR